MSSDTLRWLGTTIIAGSLAIIGVIGTFILILHNISVPEGVWALDAAAITGFLLPYGSMVGARASQNGQAVAMGNGSTHP